MFADERRQRILDLVRSSGAVSLRAISEAVQHSEVTVRRDLRLLEAQGLLDRRHGGAVSTAGRGHEPTYSEKSVVASLEKDAIGALAATLVTEGDAICVGAGTTTQAFARHLVGIGELTVITNSILVAQELARSRTIEVVMTGGTLRGSIYALVGSTAERALLGLHVHRVFLSGNGLTSNRGLSTPNPSVAGVDRALAEAGDEVVVLADHTKIGVETMAQTVPVDRIDHLITSDRTSLQMQREFADLDIQVHAVTLDSQTSINHSR